MKMAWGIRILVLAAIGLFITWIARNTYWADTTVRTPPTGAAADDRFYAAERLANSLGAHALWQRDPVSRPPPDAVLYLSNWNWGLQTGRRERIQQWVEAGGRLVVDGAMAGDPDGFEKWTGLSRVFRRPEKPKFSPPQTPKGPADYFFQQTAFGPDGSRRLAYLQVCNIAEYDTLRSREPVSWQLWNADLGIQAIRVNVGRGSVTQINPLVFGNVRISKCDHAKVFFAATQLRRGDTVWFLTEDSGAGVLQLMWRTGAPVVVLGLALVGLWLWRTGVRFGPLAAPTQIARRSLSEQIIGTGRFVVRFGDGQALHAAQVRALVETADRRIPGFTRLDSSQRIAAIARLSGVDAAALGDTMNFSGPRSRAELGRVLALLETARRHLARRQSVPDTPLNNETQREGMGHAV
ncbi:MAG TPA: hypothetical protein VGM84_07070 [Steroidobacteraceae bacterium]|jgi:hypothetical protein